MEINQVGIKLFPWEKIWDPWKNTIVKSEIIHIYMKLSFFYKNKIIMKISILNIIQISLF